MYFKLRTLVSAMAGVALGTTPVARSALAEPLAVRPDLPAFAVQKQRTARDVSHLQRVAPKTSARQQSVLATHTHTCRGDGVFNFGYGGVINCESTGSVACDTISEGWGCDFGDYSTSMARSYCFSDEYGGAYCSDGTFGDISVSCSRIPSLSANLFAQDVYCEWTVPAMTVSGPTSLAFPPTTVGATSTLTAAIRNTSTVSGTVNTVSIAPMSAPFSLSADTCSGATLNAGDTCDVTVRFAPTVGLASSATLNVTSTGTPSPLAVMLSGTGVAAAGSFGGATSTDFGGAIAGEEENQRALQFNVTASGSFVVGAVSVVGSDFRVISQDCSGTYSASRVCTVTVAFAPSGPGSSTGELQIVHGAGGSPHRVALSGEGLVGGAIMTLTPSTLTFAPEEIGVPRQQRKVLKLTNVGTGNFRLGQLATSGADYQALPAACADDLGPGASCELQVNFTPTQGGVRVSRLLVFSRGGRGVAVATLVGVGRPVEECK